MRFLCLFFTDLPCRRGLPHLLPECSEDRGEFDEFMRRRLLWSPFFECFGLFWSRSKRLEVDIPDSTDPPTEPGACFCPIRDGSSRNFGPRGEINRFDPPLIRAEEGRNDVHTVSCG